MNVRSTRPETLACKCCGGDAPFFDACDFNKSCEEGRGLFLKPSGLEIVYHRCQQCGFIFTADLDHWDDEQYSRHIYNDAYISVDPDYLATRPDNNAAMLTQMFDRQCRRLHLLDYGGGTGRLAKQLEQSRFGKVVSYDPFHDKTSAPPSSLFNIVTAFEVVEHSPTPVGTFRTMVERLKTENGLLCFSTLVQPENIEQFGCRWWYIAPRNGHISIHTQKSLSIVLKRFGLQLTSFSGQLHFAYKKVPSFAKHLIRSTQGANGY